jgi:hypothetical protein
MSFKFLAARVHYSIAIRAERESLLAALPNREERRLVCA